VGEQAPKGALIMSALLVTVSGANILHAVGGGWVIWSSMVLLVLGGMGLGMWLEAAAAPAPAPSHEAKDGG
jgi:hypothetical protein